MFESVEVGRVATIVAYAVCTAGVDDARGAARNLLEPLRSGPTPRRLARRSTVAIFDGDSCGRGQALEAAGKR